MLKIPNQAAFEAQLLVSHQMRVSVKLLSLSTGRELSDLSPRLLDGQVNIDATADVTRSADLTINDPDHVLHLDSRGAGDGGIYLDRAVSITYGVFVESLDDWIDVPIFKGPVTGLARDGSQITLTALGLEHVARGQAWHPMTFKTGHNTVATIRAILSERAGETRFFFPSATRSRLPAPLALGRLSEPWAVARSLATSINRQLYYDGSGTCQLRNRPRHVVWTFTDEQDRASVLSYPQVTYDLEGVSNLVWVRGRKPKGKPQVSGTAVASRAHPLSPWSLGRGGVPRYLVTEIDKDTVRTAAGARAIARDHLDDLLREGMDVSFDALPVPHLDPLDVVSVRTAETSITFTLKQASIPLVHSGVMSIGANKRVVPNRKKVRRR